MLITWKFLFELFGEFLLKIIKIVDHSILELLVLTYLEIESDHSLRTIVGIRVVYHDFFKLA